MTCNFSEVAQSNLRTKKDLLAWALLLNCGNDEFPHSRRLSHYQSTSIQVLYVSPSPGSTEVKFESRRMATTLLKRSRRSCYQDCSDAGNVKNEKNAVTTDHPSLLRDYVECKKPFSAGSSRTGNLEAIISGLIMWFH
jgi:hypothetical protein